MDLQLDCIPCFMRQALQAARFATDDERVIEKALREAMKILLQSEWTSTPPFLAHKVHSVVMEITGNKDPYSEVKKRSNEMVLNEYDKFMAMIEKGEEFNIALRLAIAGNIMDYGARESFDLHETVERVLGAEFSHDTTEELRNEISRSQHIAYLCDNAGEIVFDRMFIHTVNKLYGRKEWYVYVKARPIINDATREDAVMSGVINEDGVILKEIDVFSGERESDDFISELNEYDLVISKGQGNYESLSHRGVKNIFYLLMAKCPIVARDLGVPVGSINVYKEK